MSWIDDLLRGEVGATGDTGATGDAGPTGPDGPAMGGTFVADGSGDEHASSEFTSGIVVAHPSTGRYTITFPGTYPAACVAPRLTAPAGQYSRDIRQVGLADTSTTPGSTILTVEVTGVGSTIALDVRQMGISGGSPYNPASIGSVRGWAVSPNMDKAIGNGLGSGSEGACSYTIAPSGSTTFTQVDTFDITGVITTANAQGNFVRADGLRLYICDNDATTKQIHQWTLVTSWVLTGATTPVSSGSLNTYFDVLLACDFSEDGTKMFASGLLGTDGVIYEFPLSTPWLCSSWGAPTNTIVTNTLLGSTGVARAALSTTGEYIVVRTTIGGVFVLKQIRLTTAWDLSTAAAGAQSALSVPTLRDMSICPNGTIYFASGAGAADVYIGQAAAGRLPVVRDPASGDGFTFVIGGR